jgi:hypothetical protein
MPEAKNEPPKQTTSIVQFQTDGQMKFEFDGPSPFHMMTDGNSIQGTYSVERGGSIVYLSFGVREYVCRHPENWGFILQSRGSVWTSFCMPMRGTDPLLEDSNVSNLINDRIIQGFVL